MNTNQHIIAIIKCTTAVTGVSIEDMIDETRERYIADARKIVFYLVSKHTRISKVRAGKIMNRHYSTVIACVRQANNLIATDQKFASMINEAEQNYKALFTNNKISKK